MSKVLDQASSRVPTVLVVAGVIIAKSRVLLTQRKAGAHLAGLWEFPGGKVNDEEDPKDALIRELDEEIGISSTIGEILNVTFHRYEDTGRSVLLLFYRVDMLPGSPAPTAIDVAALRWAAAEELEEIEFPPADIEVVKAVKSLLQSRG